MVTPVRTPRVLMVTGAYAPEISSGGLQCQRMAEALAGRADITVLTTAVDPALAVHATIDGIPVTRVVVNVASVRSKLAAAVRMLVQLVRLTRRCDLIHVHGCSTKNVLVTVVAKVLGRPIVLSLHTAGFDEPEAVRRSGPLAWWAFRAADRYLSVSPGLVDAYLAAGLPPARIEHVPNGIDTDLFRPAERLEREALRKRLGLPLERPILIFVGFFSPDKQPHVLFDAWLALQAQRNDTTLVFVGATASPYFEVDDGLAGRMRDDARRRSLADRIVFAGVTHDVHDYLRAADIFALPSRREGLPVALIEAMACGLPCVASRLPGSTDVLIEDNANGVFVPVGDSAALAAAIAGLLDNRARATALGAAARETITRQFTIGQIAERWLAAYVPASVEGQP
jgi:glycosyltransferase involved in cell wall biosynthesis